MTVSDRAAVLARIAGPRAPFKIVVKTRDDPFFLKDWVAHHAALVGAENLVVLDNGSTDPAVLAAYAEMRQRTPILHIDGYYNDVHMPERSADLYTALRAGCDHFLFLDTDEFLVWSDGRTLRANRGSLAALEKPISADFVPTTRLDCVELYRNRFVIGTGNEAMRRQLKWGKPIIRSSSKGWPELINHNLHVRTALAPHAISGFFILHLAYVSPEQRIRSNVAKLVSRGFMKANEPLDDVLRRPVPQDGWMVGIFTEEIRRMLTLKGTSAPEDAPLSAGTIKIEPDGTLVFASEREQGVFRDYVERFAEEVRSVIVEGNYPPA